MTLLIVAAALAAFGVLVASGRRRLRAIRLNPERGASAIELAIIAAVLAAAAVAVGVVVVNKINSNGNKLNSVPDAPAPGIGGGGGGTTN